MGRLKNSGLADWHRTQSSIYRKYGWHVDSSTQESEPAVHTGRLEPGQHGGFGYGAHIPGFERILRLIYKAFPLQQPSAWHIRRPQSGRGTDHHRLSAVNIVDWGHLDRQPGWTESQRLNVRVHFKHTLFPVLREGWVRGQKKNCYQAQNSS